MIKIVTIIGARPQIIKSAALNRIINEKYSAQIKEIIIHTGQHYDKNMSDVFFRELNIPKPAYNLKIGSGKHGEQTAKMIEGIESVLIKEKPDCVILYGDTNSTLAGALAASKLKIPIAHIEAGLRSFNKVMPEEINRITCDHTSTFLFSPTQTGINNLIKEGFQKSAPPYSINNPYLCFSGDVMYDNSLYYLKTAQLKSKILNKHKLISKKYILTTIHRENNTDNINRLENIFKGLEKISIETNLQIVLPIHPRTLKTLKNLNKKLYSSIENNKNIILIPPVSFFDIIMLENNSRIIITDSGGVQKEAFFYNVPSIILRSETEWVEIIENQAGILADANPDKMIGAVNYYIDNKKIEFIPLYGEGNAAELICNKLIKSFPV